MIESLRASDVPQSIDASPALMPKAAASLTCRYVAAVSSSSLAGMQPTFRHVPPSLPFSIMAILRPADAPYSAVA